MTLPADFSRLRSFVAGFDALLSRTTDEADLLERGAALLGELLSTDDWLPDAFAERSERAYAQHLLYCDPRQRFCVVSFVWSPGGGTPVHDHTVWGLVGVLRGAEISQAFSCSSAGLRPEGPPLRLGAGEVTTVSPRIGDIHQVTNALADRPSVSIHVYGADIGAVVRSVFDADGSPKRFVSGYSSRLTPELWNGAASVSRRLGA